MRFSGKKGVTLIELLIVVSIVGLLAAIAVPKYGDLIEKANLGATIANLASLRSAYSIYYSTYLEVPKSIDPAVEPKFADVLPGGILPVVKAAYPQGNSPRGNEVAVSNVEDAVPSVMGTGWFYNAMDRKIYINSAALDIKGFSYTVY